MAVVAGQSTVAVCMLGSCDFQTDTSLTLIGHLPKSNAQVGRVRWRLKGEDGKMLAGAQGLVLRVGTDRLTSIRG